MITVELTEDEFQDVIQSIELVRNNFKTAASFGSIPYQDASERLLVLLSHLLHAKNDQAPANATEAIQAYYDRC